MTLIKAIEAAREALNLLIAQHYYDRGNCLDIIKGREALTALPDKPLSEAAIIKAVANILELKKFDFADAQATAIIQAMKAANVLYCEE